MQSLRDDWMIETLRRTGGWIIDRMFRACFCCTDNGIDVIKMKMIPEWQQPSTKTKPCTTLYATKPCTIFNAGEINFF